MNINVKKKTHIQAPTCIKQFYKQEQVLSAPNASTNLSTQTVELQHFSEHYRLNLYVAS